MRVAVEAAIISIEAVQRADLEHAPEDGARVRLVFSDYSDPDERRRHYIGWLVEKAFTEIAKGVRMALEEAYLYASYATNPPGRTTLGEFQQRLERTKASANKLNFVDLLAAVNEMLATPLHFEAEVLSLQKVRNCMEHRGGVAGPQDVDDPDELRLVLPRIAMFYRIDGVEQEVPFDERLDQADQEPDGMVQIEVRRVSRERVFKLGEPVTFGVDDLHEIAMACFMFAEDLKAKLPEVAAGVA